MANTVKKYLWITNLILVFFDVTYANSQLLSVVQVFRHGARTALVFYPNDPYQDSKYWNGLPPGALTENGMSQMFKLGKYFRERYSNFIGNDYNESEIRIESSNSPRNFKSAEFFLKGLYPNQDLIIPIEKSAWPIISATIQCVKFLTEYLKLEASYDKFLKVNENNRELYKHLRKITDFPIFGLTSALIVWDTLQAESVYGLTLPEWTQNGIYSQLQDSVNELITFVCYNEEQQKLGVGAFINNLIEHYEKIIDGSKTPKILLYSAHDLNIGCFLGAFEYFNKIDQPEWPLFASSIIIELRKDSRDEKYFVNGYYKFKDEAIPITFKNCDFDCGFDQFKELFENIRLSQADWYKQCYFL